MPTKEQLLTDHRTERDKERQRAITQGNVIAALPDGLEVRKAYTSLAHMNGRSPMQGIYEFECDTYVGLHRLLETLPPCKTVRVGMASDGGGGRKTTSFYPDDRVPEVWREEHEVIWVEPYFWEARPLNPQMARISVEWYAEPRVGLFVLCRAYIKCHSAGYEFARKDSHNPRPRVVLHMAPSGEARRVGGYSGSSSPPNVTIYWYEGSFNDVGQFVDHLVGGPTQNV